MIETGTAVKREKSFERSRRRKRVERDKVRWLLAHSSTSFVDRALSPSMRRAHRRAADVTGERTRSSGSVSALILVGRPFAVSQSLCVSGRPDAASRSKNKDAEASMRWSPGVRGLRH
jgi:hypothetical protein